MTVSWPVGVPDAIQSGGYNEVEPENTLIEKFEEGPPQTRQVSTSNPVEVDFVYEFENSEKLLFISWYRNDTGYGALPYETIDYANDGLMHTFKFASRVNKQYVGAQKWRISFKAYRLD